MPKKLGSNYYRILTEQKRPEVSVKAGFNYCEDTFGKFVEHATAATQSWWDKYEAQ
ncbi:MAG: hypothetical protein HOD72_00320 [Opitutae bacterium]|nr:hypothetical protein [Opitutae bacterium]MBT4222885.1 hypothetical protein [Opitutae bacterium]MBT5379076.1 hypothetical protein [Opitutae bacterium]MBT5689649.1 hypothetical protein [Opitutae bacterium]MBT6461872.1 hypothetical protein [Opitutae bacterium]